MHFRILWSLWILWKLWIIKTLIRCAAHITAVDGSLPSIAGNSRASGRLCMRCRWARDIISVGSCRLSITPPSTTYISAFLGMYSGKHSWLTTGSATPHVCPPGQTFDPKLRGLSHKAIWPIIILPNKEQEYEECPVFKCEFSMKLKRKNIMQVILGSSYNVLNAPLYLSFVNISKKVWQTANYLPWF